jgi:hypothetical protein
MGKQSLPSRENLLLRGQPDVTAKVYLVPYGYQVDVVIVGDDGEGHQWSVCRDFSDNYKIERLRLEVANAVIEAMRTLEGKRLRRRNPKFRNLF